MSDRILIVDDEKEFLETLSERLSVRGLEVETSTTPEKALEMAQSSTFDAIILDLKMPGMDGLEVLKALKDSHPELQIILLTGHATVDKGIEAMKLGAMDFLEKPADINSLMEKIMKAKANRMLLVEEKNREMIEKILIEKGW